MTPGVQPREGDRLQCLECGEWYRALGSHLHYAHGMTGDEYKAAHGLRQSESLRAEYLSVASREATRTWRAAHPEAFSIGDLPADVRSETSREVRRLQRETGVLSRSGHAGTRAARAKIAAASNARRAVERHDAIAKAAGYASWADFITQTVTIAAKRAGGMVDLSETQILAARRDVLGSDWRKHRRLQRARR